MPTILRHLEFAATSRTAFLISTPNLNFLVNNQVDPEFRETLLASDLCLADGMPIVWIARLLGVPIKLRASGSDIFEALKMPKRRQLKVFLFGGAEGVAAKAAEALNASPSGLKCVGTCAPGFGAIDEMSQDSIIGDVNASNADFLVVSLGAKKGQLWLYRNHKRLTIPIRAHLGATINFAAGTVQRAPKWMQVCGLEWLWRIKEEPHLWRRYAHDGLVMLPLLITRILPLAILNRSQRRKSDKKPKGLLIVSEQRLGSVSIKLAGDANQRNIGKAIACFQETLTKGGVNVVIDIAGVRVIDSRFLGLLLMVRRYLKGQGGKLEFVGVSPQMRRLFWLNDINFLLNGATEKG